MIEIKNNKFKLIYALTGVIAFFCITQQSNAQEVTNLSETNSCNNSFASCPQFRPNDIYQLGAANVSAGITINAGNVTLDGSATDTSQISADSILSTSSAIGNNISSATQNGGILSVVTGQDLTATVNSNNSVTTADPLYGALVSTTTAHGNTSQAQNTTNGIDYIVNQNITNTSTIEANSYTYTAPGLGYLQSNASAIANITGASSANGDVSFVSNQTNNGYVSAINDTTACCNINGVSVTSNASANTASSSSETASAYSWSNQTSNGNINAEASHNNNDGSEMFVSASANANQTILYNKWGYTQLAASQYSSSDINTYAVINADYYRNNALVGATSQGNSAILYTIGAEGRIAANQETSVGANINATSELNGYTEGGVGTLTSSAAGNVTTAFACTVCGPPGIGLTGDINQNNGANITATVNNNNNGYGNNSSSGTAVGNIANFVTKSRSN